MKLSPMQLAIGTIGTFFGIIALNILVRYRSDESFREQWSRIPTESLGAFRDKLVSQEQMVSVPSLSLISNDEDTESEDNNVDTGEPE